jgi:hypothetical protein
LKHDTSGFSHIFPTPPETNDIGDVGFGITQECDAPARPRSRGTAASWLKCTHLLSSQTPLVWPDRNWMADIAKILKQGLGAKARKVPSISAPDFLVGVIAIFDAVVRVRLYKLGKPRQVSSEKACRMLRWTTRLISETDQGDTTSPGC